MKTVLVTGANGFIGKNLTASLEKGNDIKILKYDIENSIDELRDCIKTADFVFHLAGVNRPKEIIEYEQGNKGFTEELLDVIKDTGNKIPVLLSSTIQAAMDNPYGLSKKGSEEVIFEYGRQTGAKVYVYRLPNVFGKWCKPNYNSVVATWCHNISRDLPIQISNPQTELDLVYIDDVVNEFINVLDGKAHASADGFFFVPRTFRIKLGQLADKLYSFKESRKTLVMPDFEGNFDRFLYATYLSYLPDRDFGYNLEMKHDNRGWLAEFIKSKQFGQIFISRTKPGITRGNHWHNTKAEKFLVIDGEALIRFKQINSSEIIEYKVSGEELKVLDIPAGYTHSITNTGHNDLITLFWADEIFDPQKPDTFYLEI
ncbi:MAG: NAD-dependent epimerase/dehydratase family protein [Patescibacteria group bacterium]|nr:NAD-dependent epimerase/dehydratase family protein [Patescibacteria group bacterium]